MGQVHADIMLLLLRQPDQGTSIHTILPDVAPEVSHSLLGLTQRRHGII